MPGRAWTYLHVRRTGAGGQVTSMAVVIATGVTATGDREVLGVDVGDSEDEVFRRGFLRSLKERGLHGTQLKVPDGVRRTPCRWFCHRQRHGCGLVRRSCTRKAGPDPTRFGAWLPRLLAGWHVGMTEVEKARLEHQEAKQKRKKQKPTGVPSEQLFAAATEAPKELPAGDATVIGAREQAEDNVVASQSEEPITVAEVPGESAARTLPPHSGATRRSRARHRERTSSPQ